jgi:hypothetical protein
VPLGSEASKESATSRSLAAMKYKTIVWFILGILALHLVYSFLSTTSSVEPFETIDDVYSEQITSFMTATSEVLCPTYMFIQEEMAREKQGSEDEKKAAALKDMTKAAGGALFPCPPPDDPLAVPANIDSRIQTTIKYFLTEIEAMMKKIQSSLDCPTEGFTAANSSHNYYEHFQDICSADQLALKKQTVEEAAAASAAKECVAPQDLTLQQRMDVLKRRADALARLLTQKEVAQQLMKIKQGTEEAKSLKKRALAGELVPNCP